MLWGVFGGVGLGGGGLVERDRGVLGVLFGVVGGGGGGLVGGRSVGSSCGVMGGGIVVVGVVGGLGGMG